MSRCTCSGSEWYVPSIQTAAAKDSGLTQTRGAYIEKLESEQTVEDPFGKVLRFVRSDYRKVAFHLTAASPNLSLFDPPRSCKAFFARIGAMMEHQIAIEPVKLNVESLIDALEGKVSGMKVTAMTVSDIAISASTRVEISVAGGMDVRNETQRLLGARRGLVTSASVEWRKHERMLSCELSTSGAAYLADPEDDIAPALRSSLQTLLR
jgi:hypothetical protein